MKSNELKEIIRSVIREELDKTLPTLIPKVLTEVLSGKQSNVIQSKESTVTTKTVVKESVQKPKTFVSEENKSSKTSKLDTSVTVRILKIIYIFIS